MAITKTELNQRVGETAVDYTDGRVTVRFHDGAITPELVESSMPTCALLARTLLSWDVLDDAGQPLVPPPGLTDDERIAAWEAILYTIPIGLLWQIERDMLAAVRSGHGRLPTAQTNLTLAA